MQEGRREVVIRKKPADREGIEQTHFFCWMRHAYPEVEVLTFHIPNGGQRSAIIGAKLKQQGVKAGVPDIFIASPRGGFHGCFIEFKAKPTKDKDGRSTKSYPSPAQKQWLARLAGQGYHAVLCYGLAAIKAAVEAYMELPEMEV